MDGCEQAKNKSQQVSSNHYKLQSVVPTSDFRLNHGLNYIQSSEKMRYLGITIDHKLTFLPHIINLEAKLSRNVGILFKRNKISTCICINNSVLGLRVGLSVSILRNKCVGIHKQIFFH